jgi:peptidyl-prolyl cis-trans isomerase C
MRDQIAAGVPQATEQVHARQILVYNSDKAAEVTASLSAGGDFATLAAQYDPVTRGDLGWFPQGYLLDPDLEAAVFALQPGETSQVVQTSAGYHVLQVIERDPQHPLDPQARLILQEHAVRDWLAARREQSKIEIILP